MMTRNTPYKSLDSSLPQIRLLRLLPPKNCVGGTKQRPWHTSIYSVETDKRNYTSDLECTFEIVSLASHPAYETLSNSWANHYFGDAAGKKPATWDEPAKEATNEMATMLLDGEAVEVGLNLAYALAALRTNEPRVLWADALCIDQGNEGEKAHQVGLMREIYRKAETVLDL
ncbi:heterokaryon incompatibility protein-domain-containing protein [Podospora aff. communis PSN243]|uniref:Heterokaryon incompatibility protein-domain-containing protein n=1 Tax=Podospora aff. communis PSN243 TaxID=3040156 RepID=A0AAV9G6H1_9PEZI|nr:heterokaryon incompatibility protein-domain-containing protein [Podospora aff. communis PSN243]